MSQHGPRRTRRGSILVPVLGVALIVSAVAFSAMMVARLQLQGAVSDNHLEEARSLALSGGEHAVSVLTTDVNWRTTYLNDVENYVTPWGGGTLSWKLYDPDLSLSDDPADPVQVLGIGRVGAAVWVAGLTYNPPLDVGPVELRSYPGGASPAQQDITADQWRGQYLRPTFPAGTVKWQVTSVELILQQSGAAGETLAVKLYTPDGSLMPGTQVDSATVAESSLPVTAAWYTLNFTGNSELDPAAGLCVTLESSTPAASARVTYEGAGVAETDSHLIVGDQIGGWTSTAADQALHYRIHGTYQVEGHIVPGTWTREPSP